MKQPNVNKLQKRVNKSTINHVRKWKDMQTSRRTCKQVNKQTCKQVNTRVSK